jgi:hypothetical protein
MPYETSVTPISGEQPDLTTPAGRIRAIPGDSEHPDPDLGCAGR